MNFICESVSRAAALPFCVRKNRGISLIAVLMFMLAATIGSTVLYRWISSENFASGSRLKYAEAQAASQSGVNAVQAYLSNRGADVGALLTEWERRQTAETAGKPILLTGKNNVLGTIGGSREQKFEVYLIGADISNYPYKLKFLSIGTARDNSKFTQSAIFEVSGLYKVSVQTKSSKCGGDIDEALWGNALSFPNLEVSSAILTQSPELMSAGGQMLNTIKITGKNGNPGYLILDGDYCTNNGIDINGDLYVTGNFDFCGNLSYIYIIKGNVYIGKCFFGHGEGTLNIKGDAYINECIDPSIRLANATGCAGARKMALTIGENNTINGYYKYLSSADGLYKHTVAGNLVMLDSVILSKNTSTDGNKFSVEGNVYFDGWLGEVTEDVTEKPLEHPLPIWGSATSQSYFTNLALKSNVGTNDTSYYYNKSSSDYIHGYVKSKGIVLSSCSDDLKKCALNGGWGADPMDGTCSNEVTGGLNYKEKLDKGENGNENACENPPIQFNKKIYEDAIKTSNIPKYIHKKDHLGSCSTESNGSVFFDNEWKDYAGDLLQKCYDAVPAEEMFGTGTAKDEKWLVVYLTNWDKFSSQKGVGTLERGKYIIIYDVSANSNAELALPKTSGNAEVMLYFPNGYVGDGSNGTVIVPTGGKYWIFTDGNISRLDTGTPDGMIGTVFMNNCSVLNSTTVGGQGEVFKAVSDKDFTQELTSIGALCLTEVGGEDCEELYNYCANGECDMSKVCSSETIADPYYIPVSSRLKADLVQLAQSKEKITENNPLSVPPKVLVMPRTIRLSADAFSRYPSESEEQALRHFYTFLYLNNKEKPSREPTPTCAPISGTSASFGLTNNLLSQGVFKCYFGSIDESNPEISPFYVVVKGKEGAAKVRLSPTDVEISGDKCDSIFVSTEQNLDDIFSVQLNVIAVSDGWKLTPTPNKEKGCSGNFVEITNTLRYSLNFECTTNDDFDGNIAKLKVCTANSSDWQMRIEIDAAMTGLIAETGSDVAIVSREYQPFNIKREDLDEVPIGYKLCPADIETNQNYEWIDLACDQKTTLKKNSSWSCKWQNNGNLTWQTNSSNLPPECKEMDDVKNGIISYPDPVADKTFNASLAWKADTISVNFVNTSTNVTFTTNNEDADDDLPIINNGEHEGKFVAYYGVEYIMTISDPNNAYEWECEKDIDCSVEVLDHGDWYRFTFDDGKLYLQSEKYRGKVVAKGDGQTTMTLTQITLPQSSSSEEESSSSEQSSSSEGESSSSSFTISITNCDASARTIEISDHSRVCTSASSYEWKTGNTNLDYEITNIDYESNGATKIIGILSNDNLISGSYKLDLSVTCEGETASYFQCSNTFTVSDGGGEVVSNNGNKITFPAGTTNFTCANGYDINTGFICQLVGNCSETTYYSAATYNGTALYCNNGAKPSLRIDSAGNICGANGGKPSVVITVTDNGITGIECWIGNN